MDAKPDVPELIERLRAERDFWKWRDLAPVLAKTNDPRAVCYFLETLNHPSDPSLDEPRWQMHSAIALTELGEVAIQPWLEALQPNPGDPNDSWRRYWVAFSMAYSRDARLFR